MGKTSRSSDQEKLDKAFEAAVASDPDRINANPPRAVQISAAYSPAKGGTAVFVSAGPEDGVVTIKFHRGDEPGAEDEIRRFRRDLAQVMAEFGIAKPWFPDHYRARTSDPASEIPALCLAIAHRIRPILVPPTEPEPELEREEVRRLVVPAPHKGGAGK